MKKLGDFLLPALARKGLKNQSESALVCFWVKEWPDCQAEPVSFSRGILKLSVASSSAAQDLQMREGDLIGYLNKKAGKKLVKGIRIIKV